ncbi:MAG: hypothetical protein PHV37_08730 [Candidatus Gastranaerophilales bacterium]|nr:hypothetical protein [Candidatus Gastranaerophilales bacterium]
MRKNASITPYKVQDYHDFQQRRNNIEKNDNPAQASTLKGVLYNRQREFSTKYEPTSDLIIMSESKMNDNVNVDVKKEQKSFDLKKALAPLAVGTVGLFAATAGMSAILKKSAKTILKTEPFEQLPDLALNMNIRQEPQFATYMMLRNPNTKTVLGAIGVCAFSGLTVLAKNFVDGVKEVWVKKQEADIQRDLQENLIDTETQAFSGKLKIERNILSDTADYFDKVFNKPHFDKNNVAKTFSSISSFKGNMEGPLKKQEETKTVATKRFVDENKKNNILLASIIGLTTIAGILCGKMTFKNLKKTTELANDYTNKFAEDIVDSIDKVTAKAEKPNIEALSKLYETICATPEYVRAGLSKVGATEDEIKSVIENVSRAKKSIFADAPIALGGITKKIQYYCYLDEDRGHLYNWIMNPDNKFMKYVFLAFSSISAMGYAGKQVVDALKAVAVSKENSNTELGLQQRLVDVELKNFESKKNSAVKPLVEEFDLRVKEGKSEEELKNLADNILMEVKNGAPFVYS